MSAPVFHSISDMFEAMRNGDIPPRSEVACGHCPWMGETTVFASHLLCCPDQTATKASIK
jgi:hypothetical protein